MKHTNTDDDWKQFTDTKVIMNLKWMDIEISTNTHCERMDASFAGMFDGALSATLQIQTYPPRSETTFVIGKDDLIRAKTASSVDPDRPDEKREMDLQDLEHLNTRKSGD